MNYSNYVMEDQVYRFMLPFGGRHPDRIPTVILLQREDCASAKSFDVFSVSVSYWQFILSPVFVVLLQAPLCW